MYIAENRVKGYCLLLIFLPKKLKFLYEVSLIIINVRVLIILLFLLCLFPMDFGLLECTGLNTDVLKSLSIEKSVLESGENV